MEKEVKVKKSLEERIKENEERLESIQKKIENLQREELSLKAKIENQRFALKHSKKEN